MSTVLFYHDLLTPRQRQPAVISSVNFILFAMQNVTRDCKIEYDYIVWRSEKHMVIRLRRRGVTESTLLNYMTDNEESLSRLGNRCRNGKGRQRGLRTRKRVR